MSWIVILFLFLMLTVVVALTGAQPEGAKPASRTRLMSAARTVLLLVGGFLLLMAFQGFTGG